MKVMKYFAVASLRKYRRKYSDIVRYLFSAKRVNVHVAMKKIWLYRRVLISRLT